MFHMIIISFHQKRHPHQDYLRRFPHVHHVARWRCRAYGATPRPTPFLAETNWRKQKRKMQLQLMVASMLRTSLILGVRRQQESFFLGHPVAQKLWLYLTISHYTSTYHIHSIQYPSPFQGQCNTGNHWSQPWTMKELPCCLPDPNHFTMIEDVSRNRSKSEPPMRTPNPKINSLEIVGNAWNL